MVLFRQLFQLHSFIHSFTHPALAVPNAHNPEMLSLLVETGSEAAGCDIRSHFCKTRQNAVQLATRHFTYSQLISEGVPR